MAGDGRTDGDPGPIDGNQDDEVMALDDDAAWEQAMRDVKPIPEQEKAASQKVEDVPSTGLAERFRQRRETKPEPGTDSAFAFDRRTVERLRRGQLPVEATLDLHGFTQEEAFAAIDAFLEQSFVDGKRCVLVITGKGTARDGGGVLRSAVPRWITEGVHQTKLIGIGPAEPQHGGDGALYVVLRRGEKEAEASR